MPSEEELKEEMLTEGLVIINSVAFIERELQKTMAEWQEAENNHFFDDIEKLQFRAKSLIKKINEEDRYMEEFMLKYKGRPNEEETILSGIK